MIGHVVDPYSEVPLYVQVANVIRADIISGKLAPRDPVPSAKQLTQQYEVARGTADKALHLIAAEGYIRAVPGRGYYVLPAEERKPRR